MNALVLQRFESVFQRRLATPEPPAALAVKEVPAFTRAVEEVLGSSQGFGGGPETWLVAMIKIPKSFTRAGENPYADVMLSSFEKYFTISFPWDLKLDVLEALVANLTFNGFNYAPFTVFANEERYQWQAWHESVVSGKFPDWSRFSMEQDEWFRSLFGYL